jgi:hypothetical protein
LRRLFSRRKLIGGKNLESNGSRREINVQIFFHLMANSNKRYNTIESLLINGSLSSNPAAIRDHAVNFYESMFAESMPWRPRLDDLAFESISAVEASSLEAPFLEKEVKDVIFGMDGNKAPGPDGFSMAFFKRVEEC